MIFRAFLLALVALAAGMPSAVVAAPQLRSVQVSPSGTVLLARFSSNVASVQAGATLAINGGTPVALSDPAYDASSNSDWIWWPLGPKRVAELLDDKDATLTGAWTNQDGSGEKFEPGYWQFANAQFRKSADPADKANYTKCEANYTKSLPSSGRYRLSAGVVWLYGPDRTTAQTYTVSDGQGVVGTFTVDLTRPPSWDRVDNLVRLHDLGHVTLRDTALTVKVSNGATAGASSPTRSTSSSTSPRRWPRRYRHLLGPRGDLHDRRRRPSPPSRGPGRAHDRRRLVPVRRVAQADDGGRLQQDLRSVLLRLADLCRPLARHDRLAAGLRGTIAHGRPGDLTAVDGTAARPLGRRSGPGTTSPTGPTRPCPARRCSGSTTPAAPPTPAAPWATPRGRLLHLRAEGVVGRPRRRREVHAPDPVRAPGLRPARPGHRPYPTPRYTFEVSLQHDEGHHGRRGLHRGGDAPPATLMTHPAAVERYKGRGFGALRFLDCDGRATAPTRSNTRTGRPPGVPGLWWGTRPRSPAAKPPAVDVGLASIAPVDADDMARWCRKANGVGVGEGDDGGAARPGHRPAARLPGPGGPTPPTGVRRQRPGRQGRLPPDPALRSSSASSPAPTTLLIQATSRGGASDEIRGPPDAGRRAQARRLPRSGWPTTRWSPTPT
jgi:hypothetical protein